ncbi:hypothetical protein HYE60_03290 [Aggregatibacter actinomycetemcomitans]|uniref:hypothetical protein n=1 Tax=Aggregatibacter actinomycetemcomitans TaxID=714 RepID=UPI00197BC7CC|nr:hypothetical protein [Aggregatibacter actinomycetemcomitans]MBN6074293.1 hypothetical protein [Aggregatibacter actinomycetemcomitans]
MTAIPNQQRSKRETEQDQTNQKLDENLDLTREVSRKIDRLDDRVDDIDGRLATLEARMDKLGVKSVVAGGLGGLVVSVGFELIKAKFGG